MLITDSNLLLLISGVYINNFEMDFIAMKFSQEKGVSMERIKSFQDIGDSTMYIEESGTGHPILFIHGIGFDHHYFNSYFDEFMEEYRLIFVNLRGSGLSSRGDVELLTVEQHAKDIDNLVHSLGLETYTLYGHSYGAIVALKHLIDYPDRVSGAVLLSGSPSSVTMEENLDKVVANIHSDELRKDVVQTIDALAKGDLKIFDAKKILRYGVFNHFPLFFSDYESPAIERVNQLLEKTVYVQEVVVEFLDNLADFDYRNQLSKISVPTLVMTGQNDILCSERDANFMVENMHAAKIMILQNAGHFGFIEAPVEHNQAMSLFLLDCRKEIEGEK